MIFEFNDYKSFVKHWIKQQDRGGYGQYSRLARILSTTTVAISQIFNHTRDLNEDQALKLATDFGLTELEKRYFVLLVAKSRAGTSDLSAFYEKQLIEIKRQALSIKNVIEHSELADSDKEEFYSSWLYLATWLATDIPENSSAPQIARRLQQKEEKIRAIINFLLERGLLVRATRGFESGNAVIHLPKTSPMIFKHHFNWRMKALESLSADDDNSVNYSAPMALSKNAAASIQKEILRLIKNATQTASKSDSETLFCLNIDWFPF